MPSYATFNRYSLTQLINEDRKQRAHLKKISEMQRHSVIDNGTPLRFPRLHQNFLKNLTEKHQEINKENEVKSKKILNIMATKHIPPAPAFHPTHQIRRNHTIHLTESNSDYFERIAKSKGKYDAREWKKQYEQHKEHLKLRKDSKLFTPLDVGANRQRMSKANSLINTHRSTLVSSSFNIPGKYDHK